MAIEPRQIYQFDDETGEVFMAFLGSDSDGWVRVAGPDASEFVTKLGARWVRIGGEWLQA